MSSIFLFSGLVDEHFHSGYSDLYEQDFLFQGLGIWWILYHSTPYRSQWHATENKN